MTGDLLLIRHAKATGQAPDAPLTPDGTEAAQWLAHALADAGITRIVSSPWRRALETARPLAARLGLTVETDGRLTERVLSGADLPDWVARLEASFADPDLILPGGESGAQARARVLSALGDARDPDGLTAVFTHGNLLALALELDHAGWAGLRNPDVWRLTGEGEAVRVEGT